MQTQLSSAVFFFFNGKCGIIEKVSPLFSALVLEHFSVFWRATPQRSLTCCWLRPHMCEVATDVPSMDLPAAFLLLLITDTKEEMSLALENAFIAVKWRWLAEACVLQAAVIPAYSELNPFCDRCGFIRSTASWPLTWTVDVTATQQADHRSEFNQSLWQASTLNAAVS